MEVTFTKGAGKYDTMTVLRADGTLESLQCPKQGIIPHDMVHFVVESVLMRSGFLTRVRDGENASFRMESLAESDGVERLVEVIQGDAWSGGMSAPDEMLDLYQTTCVARECPALPIDANDIEAIRAKMRSLTDEWNAVQVGDSLRLEL